MNKKIYLSFLLLFVVLKMMAQPELPGPGEVFVDSLVPRVDIFIDPDTLEWIYENVESYQEFHAVFVFDNGNIKDTLENVGFRLRGNTSRYSAKKSFKVSFNTFEPGRKWYGLEKVNLNGEHNDPTITRAKLCWDMLNDLEVPGSRSSHVELYINNNYHGLYINVEHVDEEFVLSRFGNNDGNLFKCLWPADLNYLGSNPDNYKVMQGDDRRVYDLKTNTIADDYSDLAHFIDVLNNTPDDQFLCEIEKVFNIYDYLKIIAFDVFTANWDGYIYNKNNFYLYHNTETDKFEYINYDTDNTYGIDWFQIDWAIQNIYSWESGERPLYTRVMENEILREQYSYYIDYLNSQLVDIPAYTERIDELKWQNSPFVENDPFYPLDYGFSHDDYLEAFDEGLGMHVPYGIHPYANKRKLFIYLQVDNYEKIPVIKHIRNNHPQAGESFKVRASLDCLDEGAEVLLMYSINLGPALPATMYDDGEHADKDPNDGIYGAILPDMEYGTTITYMISATNSNQKNTLLPCEPNSYELIESENPALFINEFMASNLTTIADEFGEYDDWIEVYNMDEEAVWLGDKYLTDNLNNSDKWQMPDFTLEPGGFVLFWADNDPEQGEFHTNFKLDADGEEIGIFDAENTGFQLLDSLQYGPQTTDVSKGRKPDGEAEWVFFTASTPGYSNSLGPVSETSTGRNQLIVSPNPAGSGEVFFNKEISFTLYSSSGSVVTRNENSSSMTTSGIPKGLYIVVTNNGESARLIIK